MPTVHIFCVFAYKQRTRCTVCGRLCMRLRGCSVCGYAHLCVTKWEHCTCVHPRRISAGALALLYCVSIFIHMGSSSRGQMLGNPQNQSWSRTIITAILIKVSHCDPLIFSQCWLHCNAVTTSITELQPVINLHIIYMFPNQRTANPNPKITPTWTGNTSPFVKFKHFPPSSSHLDMIQWWCLLPAYEQIEVCVILQSDTNIFLWKHVCTLCDLPIFFFFSPS